METCKGGKFCVLVQMFKSYYVVWKHDFMANWEEMENGLNRTM